MPQREVNASGANDDAIEAPFKRDVLRTRLWAVCRKIFAVSGDRSLIDWLW